MARRNGPTAGSDAGTDLPRNTPAAGFRADKDDERENRAWQYA